MTFDEAYQRIVNAGVISISTDEGRQYIWDCVTASIPIGPAVEVGSCYGGTTALMAMAGAQVFSVDNWTSRVRDQCEANLVKLGVRDQVTMIMGNSVDMQGQFVDQSLGYVMIDADHWGDAPFNDICAYAPKIAPSGFLLVDAAQNGHPDITRGLLRWLTTPEARDFRFDRDIRRRETCSSLHWQTTLVGFCRAHPTGKAGWAL